jgi:hypothetical protein
MKFGSSNSECSTTHAGTATGSKEVSVIVVPTELNGVQVPPRLKRVFRLNAIARCDSHVARHLVLHRSGRPGNCSAIVALPSPAEHFLRGLKGSLFLPIHSRDRAPPPPPGRRTSPKHFPTVQYHGSSILVSRRIIHFHPDQRHLIRISDDESGHSRGH